MERLSFAPSKDERRKRGEEGERTSTSHSLSVIIKRKEAITQKGNSGD
jgi:hypothetical protein